jgi:phosphoribosylformimino-5-aminoimidazole carboxamide ribotide isomerase
MQIIPVIDVMGGHVVAAQAGNRRFYEPIQSQLTDKVDPISVVSALLKLHEFKVIYVADLDAIQTGTPNKAFYHRLCNSFPETKFWFDFGVKQQRDFSVLPLSTNAVAVVGTETMADISLLEQSECILSLDYQRGRPLGMFDLSKHSELWPKHVIAMNLDRVGMNSGPDYELIQQLKTRQKQSVIYAAGGVRNQHDLMLLKRMGAGGALVSSALHNGTINQTVLEQL